MGGVEHTPRGGVCVSRNPRDASAMTDEEEALAANAAFYSAFAASDAERMDGIWARKAQVACVHPGWEVLSGRDAVMESWRRMFETGGGAPPPFGKGGVRPPPPAAALSSFWWGAGGA